MAPRKDNNLYEGDSDLFDVENVIKCRTKKKKKEYLVQWTGYSSEHNSWIPGVDLSSDWKLFIRQEKALAKKGRKRKHDSSIQTSAKKIRTEEADQTEIMDHSEIIDHQEITDNQENTDNPEITKKSTMAMENVPIPLMNNKPLKYESSKIPDHSKLTKKSTMGTLENVPIPLMHNKPVKYEYKDILFYPKSQVRQVRQSEEQVQSVDKAPNKSSKRSVSLHPKEQRKRQSNDEDKAPNKSSKRSVSLQPKEQRKRQSNDEDKAPNTSSKRSVSLHPKEQRKRQSNDEDKALLGYDEYMKPHFV